MNIITTKGKLIKAGKIELETEITIDWEMLSKVQLPGIPIGSSFEITIAFDENEFISGRNGIVWATYDLKQAEIIRNALLALQINTEIIKKVHSTNSKVYLMKAANENEIEDAVDFIWKSGSGLRLKPDWTYPDGTVNISFEQWLSGQ